MKDKEIEFPVRINRYLALKNRCVRRKADEWIKQGRVFVNEEPAVLGQKVFRSDKVKVLARGLTKLSQEKKYYAFNKPVGVVAEKSKPSQESVRELADLGKDFFTAGPVSKEMAGLVVITNDSRVNERILKSAKLVQGEYIAEFSEPVNSRLEKQLENGVKLKSGFITDRALVSSSKDKHKLRIALTLQKKNQLLKMFQALGVEPKQIVRVRINNVRLSGLKPGQKREINKKELKVFLKSLGIVR